LFDAAGVQCSFWIAGVGAPPKSGRLSAAVVPASEATLRELTLKAIAHHPVRPQGMDVSIQALGDGNWEALSIPPGQGFAYADGVHYISQVTKAIRLNYYLQVLAGIRIDATVTSEPEIRRRCDYSTTRCSKLA